MIKYRIDKYRLERLSLFSHTTEEEDARSAFCLYTYYTRPDVGGKFASR